MSNETGKKTYLEYVNDNLYGGSEADQFHYDGLPLSENSAFYCNGLFVPKALELFTRAPKTQLINGHEVVAPRYDEPDKGVDIFYLDFGQDDGIYKDAYNQMLNTKIQAFGWFDNKPDAIAYANAHRENK